MARASLCRAGWYAGLREFARLLPALSLRAAVHRAGKETGLQLNLVGTGRFELPTCRLGGDRSIHLSYVPALYFDSTSALAPSVRYPSGSAYPRSGSCAPRRTYFESRSAASGREP